MTRRISALLFAALIGGCVGDNSLVIMQNGVPEVVGNTCVAPAGESSTFRSSGTLDLSFYSYGGSPQPTGGYWLFPTVKNNLSASVGGTSVGTSTTAFNIAVTRVDVELQDAVTEASLAPRFSVSVFKVLEAGGVMGVPVEVIPITMVSSLSDGQLVMAKVQVVGNRDGGEIRSNTMPYAISVCSGCLFDDAGPCVDFTGAGSANSCNIAQDEVAVCCEHSTRGIICPAEAETITPQG